MTTLQEQSSLCLAEMKPNFPSLTQQSSEATTVGIECGLRGMTKDKQYRHKHQPSDLTLGWEDIALVAVGPDTSASAASNSLRLFVHCSQCSRNHDGTIAGINTRSTNNYHITGLAGPFPLVPIVYEGNYEDVFHWSGSFDSNEFKKFVDRLREYEASGASEKPTLYTAQIEAFDEEEDGMVTDTEKMSAKVFPPGKRVHTVPALLCFYFRERILRLVTGILWQELAYGLKKYLSSPHMIYIALAIVRLVSSKAMPYYLSEESDLGRCAITVPANDTDDPAQSLSEMTGDSTHGSFFPADRPAFFDMQGKIATLDDRSWGLQCEVVSTTELVLKETSREGETASSNETKRQRITTLKLVQPLTLCLTLGPSGQDGTSDTAGKDQDWDIVTRIRSLGKVEGDIDLEETCGIFKRRINRDPSMTAVVLPPDGVELYHAFYPITQRLLQTTGPDSQDTYQMHDHMNSGGSMLLVAPARSRYRLDDGRTLLLGGKLRQDGDQSTTYDVLIIETHLDESAKIPEDQNDHHSDASDATEVGRGKGNPCEL